MAVLRHRCLAPSAAFTTLHDSHFTTHERRPRRSISWASARADGASEGASLVESRQSAGGSFTAKGIAPLGEPMHVWLDTAGRSCNLSTASRPARTSGEDVHGATADGDGIKWDAGKRGSIGR